MSLKEGLSTSSINAWRTAIVSSALLFSLTFLLYQETLSYLIGIWNQLEMGDYAHGYLVLLISVYMIYDRRSQLKRLVPNTNYTAVILLIPAGLLWLAAAIVNVEVVQSVALLMLIMAIVWASFGSQLGRVLALPILYIIFALPVWFPLSPVLQNLTADAVFWLIRVIEIPALREENMIILSSGRLSIEEACSGLRYLLAALTLGTLYAYLNYQSLRSRVIIVLISASAAVLANIVRVFIIVYLAYETDMQHPLVADHLTFGWYIFSGLIFLLLVIDVLVHRMIVQPKVINETEKGTLTVLSQVSASKNIVGSIFFVTFVAILISIGPMMVMWSNSQSSSENISYNNLLSQVDDNWKVMDIADDWTPVYHGADTFKVTYQGSEHKKVHLFLGVYAAQRQGHELVNDLNSISDGKIWRLSHQRVKLHEIEGQKVLEQLLEKADGTKRLVWYWYRVAGQNTVNKYVAKALQLKGALTGVKRASIVAITTKVESDAESARKRMNQFIVERQLSINDTIDGRS